MANRRVKPAVTNRPTLEFLFYHLWQPPMILREQEGKEVYREQKSEAEWISKRWGDDNM